MFLVDDDTVEVTAGDDAMVSLTTDVSMVQQMERPFVVMEQLAIRRF